MVTEGKQINKERVRAYFRPQVKKEQYVCYILTLIEGAFEFAEPYAFICAKSWLKPECLLSQKETFRRIRVWDFMEDA